MRVVSRDRPRAIVAEIERRMESAGRDAQRIFLCLRFRLVLSIHSAVGRPRAAGTGSTSAGGSRGGIARKRFSAEYAGVGGVAGADAFAEIIGSVDYFRISARTRQSDRRDG